MNMNRYSGCSHTASILANGKLLVAGGKSNVSLNTVELYDSVTGS